MSLKRKAEQGEHVKKKAKSDFFAPRIASSKAEQFSFEAKANDAIRIVTWNVNGIKSVEEKILKRYLEAEDPSILIMTETKYSKGKPDILCLKTRFKFHYWAADPRLGYAGVAVLSKFKPLNVTIGIPAWNHPSEETTGRYVELEFHSAFIIGTYVPNAGENFQNMDFKRAWNGAFTKRIRELQSKKSVIWAGDFNCIPTKKDIDKTALAFWDTMSGLSAIERDAYEEILNPNDPKLPKFVDIWRHMNPIKEEYTHSSAKYGAWRLDSFILSDDLVGYAKTCEIRHKLKDQKLSDHWPVMLDIRLSLE